MRTRFTLTDIETGETVWVLIHDPEKEIPFTTVQGTPRIWNWDFIRGVLVCDGEPVTAYGIAVELA